jgi:HEPN domain-containing protein
MSLNEALKAWITSASEDWEVAEDLFASKKYHHCLFFVQLTLEKLFKALHTKRHDEHPLFVHNLVLLAQRAELKLTLEEEVQLKEISSFNVSARYDSFKRDFYKKATLQFTKKWFEIGASWRQRLLDLLGIPKKK